MQSVVGFGCPLGKEGTDAPASRRKVGGPRRYFNGKAPYVFLAPYLALTSVFLVRVLPMPVLKHQLSHVRRRPHAPPARACPDPSATATGGHARRPSGPITDQCVVSPGNVHQVVSEREMPAARARGIARLRMFSITGGGFFPCSGGFGKAW